MNTGRLVAGSVALVFLFTAALAQAAPILPILDDKPSPQIDAGGPSAAVTALAFGNGGETLYAAGLDKVVRVWTLQNGKFVLKATYRVPVGPGNTGAVNAVALSPDGAWIAMAGRAPIRGESGFRHGGMIVVETSILSPEKNRDAGVIYVASTANPAGGKVLRGHRGEVRALAFAPARQGKAPLLVSAASERDGEHHFGGLRLWDAAAGKLLAERTDLPAKPGRPGLAVWQTGPAATQVRVAVAWPEENNKQSYFRLWDAGPNAEPLQVWKENRFTRTAVLLGEDGGASVLTAGLGPDDAGRLRIWRLSADRQTIARFGTEISFPPRNGIKFLPVSLTIVVSRSRSPSYAAVILQPSGDADFRLAIVDLRANRIVVDLPLTGSDKTQLPAIAAHGRYLAVAATSDHAVRVYAVADLLQGKAQPQAILAGAGLSPQRVAFVDKGQGLWLSEDGRSRPLTGGLLFDLDKRQVRANTGAGFADDTPELGEWSFLIDSDRKGVRVRRGRTDLPPVRLQGKEEIVTAAALRPGAPGQPGLLAVAYTERDANRTLIMLCDPASGKPYRLLVSHLQDVRDLAFSGSRSLLASVADDQTVCLWSLADVDRAVGQVPGLRVGEAGNVVVRGVEPGSLAAKAGLAEGDVLQKIGVPGGQAKSIKDAEDFQLTVAARRPGGQVDVAVAGKGTIKLPIERGVDERKPLFSLFFLRSAGLPEWVGWSPAGPYDYSSPAAEAHLGWQTNTGDPAAPVSYAAAREYRKDYYREGILRYLSMEADLGRALQKWNADHPARPPQPALRPLRPDGALPGDRAREYVVRQSVKTLRVGINEDYALDARNVLRWRITRTDGGKVGADAADLSGQALRDGKEWQADLAGVDWRRGEYRVRLGLHASTAGPELASETAILCFQPPAPKVALRLGGKAVTTTERKPLKIMEEKLVMQAAVETPAGQEVEVQFTQTCNGVPTKNASAAHAQTGPGAFAQEFKLEEGLNRLVMRAINRGALTGREDEEAAETEVWVSYKAPRELPPRFAVLRLEPEPEVKRHGGKDVWVVSRPAIRFTCKIEAAGVLVQADWSDGGNPKTVLPPGEKQVAEFAANLDLKAGEVVPMRLQARSKHSDLNTTECWVVFYPPLPTVMTDPLDSPDALTEKVTLSGTFQAATKDPFDLLFRVTSSDGKVASFKPELDLKADKWKVELALFPGSNTVETIVANKWRGERAIDGVLRLRYRRPPQITTLPEKVEAVETNKVKLPMTVVGPAGRSLTALKVDREPVHFEAGKPETQGDRWIWRVELPEVFVNDGERNLERIAIQAVTDEGESRAVVVRIVHKKIPRLPRAQFLQPAASDTARRPEYPVTFRVESERPLQRVEIRRGSTVLYQADLKKVQREGPLYVLQEDALLPLVNGANALELLAVNMDGRSPRAEVVVSYTEPAVLVRIDRIELLAGNGKAQQVLEPTYASNGDAIFPTAPGSLVWLVGRVRWSDAKARALDDRGLEVVVKVGDCRQFPVALGPRGMDADAKVRPFHVPLVLIGSENRIRIELPSVGQQELSCREFDLACTAPAKDQRLHVLIVGVNVNDWVELKERVLDALVVDPKNRPPGAQGEFSKKPPFERCILYHVLAGDVDRGKVEAQLVEINREITRLRRQSGWLNDVVLIYYQGEDVEVPGKKERWLKTSRNFQFPKVPLQVFAIPCHALPRVPGVELLLLNVPWTPDLHMAGSDWGGDPDAGLLRYASHDPTETCKPDPALLGLLQEAIRKKGRLGEVVTYVDDLLGKQPARFSRLIVLDPYQANRRISEPAR
jgi:WD40 repeat protein